MNNTRTAPSSEPEVLGILGYSRCGQAPAEFDPHAVARAFRAVVRLARGAQPASNADEGQ
jgi:hypothetical protein